MDYYALGQRIRYVRRMRDITQAQLAELVGCSVSFIGHIERGTRILSVETLFLICNSLQISADFLLQVQQTPLVVNTIGARQISFEKGKSL